MKKLVLVVVAVVLFSQLDAQAQKIMAKNVPTAVTQAFKKAYPTVTDIDWSKDGVNYEAEYDSKNGDKSVTYNAQGVLLETEKDIKVADLPASITTYVKNNHKGHSIKEASKITTASGVMTYEAQVNGMDLIFDSAGMFIRSEKK